MLARAGWIVCWFLGLGCHCLVALQIDPDSSPAAQLWRLGQEAMKTGRPAAAIGFYEKSLALDPAFTRNHMSLAAAHLETGNELAACVHLGRYVAAHPDHTLARSHYAELLLRLRRPGEARAQFERVVADAQDQGSEMARHLIHGHTRLMEIAEAERDGYGEHLHRGIGLYLLARQRAAVADARDELPAEGLLFRAASELAQARRHRPDEARPCWYLYRVWASLAQRQTALRWLQAARMAAPLSYLTPAEQRSLQLACWLEDERQPR